MEEALKGHAFNICFQYIYIYICSSQVKEACLQSCWAQSPGGRARPAGGTRRAGVSKKVEATSTVTPRARSSGRSSSSHAQAKEPLPAALASFSALWAAFWLTCL